MQKILKILEKNVEWLAVALGAAFLLWMVYLYAFQKPVVTTVGTSKLTPGDVDTRTVDGPVAALQKAMSGSDKDVPSMPEQDFVSALQKRLDPDVAALAMSTPWSGEPLPASVMKGPAPESGPAAAVVTALPGAAAPDSLQFSQGRSNVMIPPPPPQGGPAAAPVTGQGTPADKNWVTVAGIIHTKPIADEFALKKIPPQLNLTLVLRVEMVRQEQQDDGSWGPDQTIPPLSNVSLEPLPANNANQQAVQLPYKDWAEKDQKDLLQPDFYQVLQADPWTMPGVTPPAPPEAPFDPSTVTDPSTLTPDQQKQYEDYQTKKAQDEKQRRQQLQQQRGPQAPYPQGPGAGGPGGYRGVADDAQRPLTLAQAIGPAGAPMQPLPPGPAGVPMPQGGPADAAAANNANPAMNNPTATLPAGSFDPTKQPDIVVWAHDDTVQPGKTYRYKLRYYLKNPVMQTNHVCNPQKLADLFYIVSADSAWTDAVTVKSETNFFAVSVTPSARNPSVKFDIFRWKNGAWQMQTTNAGPGDMIGTVDPTTQTDFTTGLTVVAVLPDSSNPKTVLLTTEGGMLLRRDLTTDQNSPDHKKLKDDATKALVPKTAAAPTP